METWTVEQARAHFAKTKPHQPAKGKGSNAKAEMEMMLQLSGLPWVKEHRFHPVRMWRLDYAIPSLKIGFEYEGVFGGGKSRHTTVNGFTEDTDKYNAAQELGWKVYRYTAKNYRNMGTVLQGLVTKQST